jgi:hypothetical protein
MLRLRRDVRRALPVAGAAVLRRRRHHRAAGGPRPGRGRVRLLGGQPGGGRPGPTTARDAERLHAVLPGGRDTAGEVPLTEQEEANLRESATSRWARTEIEKRGHEDRPKFCGRCPTIRTPLGQRVGCCSTEYRSGFPRKREDVPDESDRFYLDADNVRKVGFFHQPPGREHVRVTVEYVSGEVKVFEVTRACSRACSRSCSPSDRGSEASEKATSRRVGE